MVSLNAMRIPSKRLILSYILDWVVILAIAAVGGGWNWLTPYHRPFSLTNLSISYPYVPNELIPTWMLVTVSMVVPGAIILLVCFIFVPGPTASRNTPKSLIWRRKLWEWNTGWMGLGLSLATAFLITQGMKNLFGKPRPSLLARCVPDLTRLEEFTVGNYGSTVDTRWVLVSSGICTQMDKVILNDGFRSFPSGHSSFSWSGLTYLTFFLCSKFAVAIPFLSPRPYSNDNTHTAMEDSPLDTLPPHHNNRSRPQHAREESSISTSSKDSSSGLATRRTPTTDSNISDVVPIRNQAAAPPTYLLVLLFTPPCAALYISSTRYAEFYHFGIDIVTGSLIGILSAWFAFRWYHLPIRQGAGWSWGARSRDRAFGAGVGRSGYVGPEGWLSARSEKARGASRKQPDSVAPAKDDDITGPGVEGDVEAQLHETSDGLRRPGQAL